jgi:hypothetical protein
VTQFAFLICCLCSIPATSGIEAFLSVVELGLNLVRYIIVNSMKAGVDGKEEYPFPISIVPMLGAFFSCGRFIDVLAVLITDVYVLHFRHEQVVYFFSGSTCSLYTVEGQ